MRTKRKARWFAIGSAITAAMALAVVAPASPAGAQVAGREVVTVSTGRTSANKSITANCDPGQVVIGAAAWMVNGAGQVRITKMIPRTTYVYVYAAEDETGAAVDWDLFASATCADPIPGLEIIEVPSGPTAVQDVDTTVIALCTGGDRLLGAGYEIVSRIGQDTSDYVRSQRAACPTDKEILGVGGWVHDGNGQVVIEDFHHDDDEVLITAFEDDTGMSGQWHVHAYAICADE